MMWRPKHAVTLSDIRTMVTTGKRTKIKDLVHEFRRGCAWELRRLTSNHERQTNLIPSRPKEHNLRVFFVHHPDRASKPIIEYLLHIIPSEDLVESFDSRT